MGRLASYMCDCGEVGQLDGMRAVQKALCDHMGANATCDTGEYSYGGSNGHSVTIVVRKIAGALEHRIKNAGHKDWVPPFPQRKKDEQ